MNSLGAFLQNLFLNRNRYRVHQDAVIISCFYNPQGNPYRLLAFQKWYNSIKHLPHRIVECLIGPNAKSQLPKSPHITQVKTDSLLWHKETLLNKLVRELPKEYKYVFWMDADVLITNKNWIREGVEALRTYASIIQPFEYCIHLKRNQLKPDFDIEPHRTNCGNAQRHPQIWRSFCAVYEKSKYCGERYQLAKEHNFDRHGHTGFVWGARRGLLEACPLYEKCFVGGGDHIVAHAAAGHIPHTCIRTAFADNIEAVEAWSRGFYRNFGGRIGYVPGDLYHIWHGDIKARNYYNAVKTFSSTAKEIEERDENGLYISGDKNQFIKEHYPRREARRVTVDESGFDGFDAGFIQDMGYSLGEIAHMFGQPTYAEPDFTQPPMADNDTLPGRLFEVPVAPPVTPASEPPLEFLTQPNARETLPAPTEVTQPHNQDFGSTFS